MARGFKSGGRTKGTPNRKTQEVVERLEALGCDPIEGMARIAMNEANPPELRGRMFAELAGYVAPKRKAVEYSATDGSGFQFSWMAAAETRELSSAELTDVVLQRIAGGEIESNEVPRLMDLLRTQIGARVS